MIDRYNQPNQIKTNPLSEKVLLPKRNSGILKVCNVNTYRICQLYFPPLGIQMDLLVRKKKFK